MASLEEQLKDEVAVKRFAKYLHSTIPLREAQQLSKRVNYFRGRKLLEVLVANGAAAEEPKSKEAKGRPGCASEAEAKQVGVALLRMGLIHASEVANKQKRELRPLRTQDVFTADGYYTWIYEGSKTMRNAMLALLGVAFVGMCMYPIWPASIKTGIWYVSVTLLIFLFVLFTVRLVVYVTFWAGGFEFWILPNFFDEDLGVLESFLPVYSFSKAGDLGDTWYFRAAGAVMLLAFVYWCTQQPTDFDELYASQMEFLAELYDGKLLSSPLEESTVPKLDNSIPDLEELQKQVEEDVHAVDDKDDKEDSEDSEMAGEGEGDEGESEDEGDDALEAILEAEAQEAAAREAAMQMDGDDEDDEDDDDNEPENAQDDEDDEDDEEEEDMDI